jgi:hypothetical protein
MDFSEESRTAPPAFSGAKGRGVRRPLGGIWPPPEGASAVGRLLKKIGPMNEPHH